jgi:CMP-N-acetylneuraminic acid synthetase
VKTYAFVFARGGSKGLPGKNIRKLGDKPLLAHSIDCAKSIPEISQIFVSTDNQEIAQVATSLGAIVIERPTDLAQDNSPEWSAWQHAIRWVQEYYGEFECFVSLPTTSPLRILEDVRACISALDAETDLVITMTETNRSPWFNMLNCSKNGYVRLLLDGNRNYVCRQEVPKAYDMTTIAYVSRPSFVLKCNGIWDGNVRGVFVPQERSIDIDTLFDFKIAEFLISERHNKE